MVLDYCRAVALWHQHNTFNHHAPSCSGAFSRVTQGMLGRVLFWDPLLRSSSTPRLARALPVWSDDMGSLRNIYSLKTSLSRSQFLDIAQHHRAWIGSTN